MAKINTVTSREKLAPRREPYWHPITKGQYLGFRATGNGLGTWIARAALGDTGKKKYQALGDLSNLPPSLQFDAAKKAAAEWFSHLDKGGSHTSITVAEACARYLTHLRNEGRADTAKDTQARFKRFVLNDKRLAATPMQRLTGAQLSDWRTKLVNTPTIKQDARKPEKPRAKSTINRDMNSFKAALNLAFEDGFATTDAPWRVKLKPFESANGRRTEYMTLEQRRALVQACPADLAGLVQCLSMLPLRPGAAAALTAGSLDKATNTLTVGKDKAGEDRRIGLPQSIASFLSEHTRNKLPGAPMFCRADGRAWDKDAWKGPFKAAALAAGLPDGAVMYTLRHSAITDLIALHRLDTLTVAALSGTSLVMIDKHYGQRLKEHGANALDKLAFNC